MKRSPAFLILAMLFACRMMAVPDAPKPPQKTVYDYSLVNLDGKESSLATYKGKVLLIVNLASQSIYQDQIAALDALQKTYADQGLVVIGIPSTDFGGQELADNAAIRKYYAETAHVAFPVFAKASLHGPTEIPLYQFLTDPKTGIAGGGIHWNFTKFLIDREGKTLARFEVDQDPGDVDFHVIIEKALAGTYKKKASSDKPADAAGSDDDDDQ
jgi:glutathione peroxidase